MKMREVKGWPPDSFARVGPGTVPALPSQVTIGDVLKVLMDSVLFSCGYGDETVRCSFFTRDAKLAEEVAKILTEHEGENLLSISEVEIPED
jgi:hypothetical protein